MDPGHFADQLMSRARSKKQAKLVNVVDPHGNAWRLFEDGRVLAFGSQLPEYQTTNVGDCKVLVDMGAVSTGTETTQLPVRYAASHVHVCTECFVAGDLHVLQFVGGNLEIQVPAGRSLNDALRSLLPPKSAKQI